MPKNPAVRITSGLAAGLLITVAMFAVLFNLVNVRFEGEILKPVRIEFTRVIDDSDIRIPRPPLPKKVVRETLPETPRIPNDPAPDSRDKPITRVDTNLVSRDGYRGIEGLDGDGLSFGTDQDVQPRVRMTPDYPMQALTRGVEGWVRVQFTITATGSVQDARVVAAEPRGIFDEAALSAISRWRYEPRIVDGEPVERVGLQTTIEFQLTE